MVTLWEIVANRLAGTIREEYARVVPEHRVPYGRFDTYAGRAARDDEVLHPHLLENGIQLRLVEPAETMFV